jgi:exodeoxyribonuclease VII small subunit
MAKKEIKPIEKMKYEEAFQELQDLVERLESNELQLEEGLELFERGQLLVDRCTQLLVEADLKIKQISTKASGEFIETDLTIEEG